jgi:multidrug transporter EmrE-like cation transporter
MKWVVPISLLIFFEAIADILAKSWQIHRGYTLAAFSLVGYLIANTFWLFALKNGSGLGRGGIIFSVASAALAIIIGFLLYQETISTKQIIGLIFGLVSIIFLTI